MLEGGLRVDDQFVVWGTTGAAVPRPQAGDVFSAIRGVLMYTFNQEKLEPRTAADLVK